MVGFKNNQNPLHMFVHYFQIQINKNAMTNVPYIAVFEKVVKVLVYIVDNGRS